MKGKAGLVIGLAVGYVLGTRAGRERYEQIKEQWLKVWNLDPRAGAGRQGEGLRQVDRHGAAEHAVGLGRQGHEGRVREGHPGQKLDAAIKVGKDQADDVGGGRRDIRARREGCRGGRLRRHRGSAPKPSGA